MKSFFIAYRFSGESHEVLESRMNTVVKAMKTAGIQGHSNLVDHEEHTRLKLSNKEIMDLAFKKIDEKDGLFVLIASSDKSEGQLMEVGYALAKNKKIIVAVKTGSNTYVPDLADEVIEWNDLDDLSEKIEGLKL